ncbi:MAG: hypothetical protein ACI9UV_002318 [Algoriphagus sp.]|jgi:hypothetical protein|tara:strand:- start:146 stop:397 length:252 start_codon:yes stop_codon:yes gene_type:complete
MIHAFLVGFFNFSFLARLRNLNLKKSEIESKHSIAFVIGHARIGQGRNSEGDKEFLTVLSFAFDYNYWLSERWAIGLYQKVFE